MNSLSRRTLGGWGLALLCTGMLAACDDDTAGSEDKVIAMKRPSDLPAWLTVKDKIEPSVWLRSREVGHEVLSSDPEVDRLRRAMHQAEIRFYEDPRMIANRTAQIADMLGEINQPERYVDIMTGMVDVADVSPSRQLYGEMCEHYLNIRKLGKDRTAALEQLSSSYKIQNQMR